MLLEFNGIFQKYEEKESKKGSKYLDVRLKEQITNRDERIFIFNNELIEKIKKLNNGDNVCVIFNRFYSFSDEEYVFLVKDVVVL